MRIETEFLQDFVVSNLTIEQSYVELRVQTGKLRQIFGIHWKRKT